MQLSTLSTQLVSWLISHCKDRISWQTAVVGDDSDSLPVHNFPIRNKARVRAGNSNVGSRLGTKYLMGNWYGLFPQSTGTKSPGDNFKRTIILKDFSDYFILWFYKHDKNGRNSIVGMYYIRVYCELVEYTLFCQTIIFDTENETHLK